MDNIFLVISISEAFRKYFNPERYFSLLTRLYVSHYIMNMHTYLAHTIYEYALVEIFWTKSFDHLDFLFKN